MRLRELWSKEKRLAMGTDWVKLDLGWLESAGGKVGFSVWAFSLFFLGYWTRGEGLG